ncbi:hypothetical protein [Pseudobacillus wudalianchiensis]|uniref:DUF4083 domain-containing protein n=1 Tax=Pseudobacillus wudalianchiensis TaxID=1743143 RepID=A0A1B9B892_9BACI|nr:hypothetical protein [Bacillus wudalianchiensis]OCA92310.1 hypothetical protein A8F95_00865 [Bacillus wudalianchiensis]
MFNGTLFASDGAFIFFTFLPIVIYLVLTGVGIYFVIKVITFMNEKIKLDRERNERISELIKTTSLSKKIE